MKSEKRNKMINIFNCKYAQNANGSLTVEGQRADSKIEAGEITITLPAGWSITISEINGGGISPHLGCSHCQDREIETLQ